MPGSILELEKENFAADGKRRQVYCFAVSAKRYALYVLEDGEPAIVKPSQHALGYLLNPVDPEAESRDWIEELWELEVRKALGLPAREPDWVDRPGAAGRRSALWHRRFPGRHELKVQRDRPNRGQAHIRGLDTSRPLFVAGLAS